MINKMEVQKILINNIKKKKYYNVDIFYQNSFLKIL